MKIEAPRTRDSRRQATYETSQREQHNDETIATRALSWPPPRLETIFGRPSVLGARVHTDLRLRRHGLKAVCERALSSSVTR